MIQFGGSCLGCVIVASGVPCGLFGFVLDLSSFGCDLVYLGLVINVLCFRFEWFVWVCFVLICGSWVFT